MHFPLIIFDPRIFLSHLLFLQLIFGYIFLYLLYHLLLNGLEFLYPQSISIIDFCQFLLDLHPLPYSFLLDLAKFDSIILIVLDFEVEFLLEEGDRPLSIH